MHVYKLSDGRFYKIPCPYCGSIEHVNRNGIQYNGIQRYKCMDCLRSFQERYIRSGVDLRQRVNHGKIHTVYSNMGVPLR